MKNATNRPTEPRSTRPRMLAGLLAAALLATLAPAATLAADTAAPGVTVTAPTSGSTVTGFATLTANASDSVGVTQVRWFVDGVEARQDSTWPWSVTWNSSTVAAGTHKIYARARDAAGNWGTSATVTFTVRSMAGWRLVQSEGFSGSAVDTTKWSIYGPWKPGHAGNGIRDGSAIKVANGLLTITARMVNGTLVSGGLSNKLNQAYGRWEFRVRTDADPSLATNGVVLTWPQSQNWPIDGENDIYETMLDADRNPFKTYIHYGSTNQQYYFHHNGVDGTQWHTMAMEWEPTAIRIYRDGMLVWTLTDTKAIPDVAHHMSIQLDAFKKSMTGAVRLQVDWVKIYRRS